VVKVNFALIFDQIFNHEKDNYECREKNTHPFNAAVVFAMQVFVLDIGIGDHSSKEDYKKNGENELSFAEHIFIFVQN
jgi:ribosome biogenesis protein Nip4